MRERGPLIAVTVGAAVVEAAVLVAAGHDGLALAAHVSAPTPFGTFHDARWVLAFHTGWVGLGLEAMAAVVLRGLFIATCVRAAWPRGQGAPPSLRVAWLRGVVVSGAGMVLLAPWVALLFGMAVTPVSWLWFAGVTPVLVLAPLTHQAAVGGAPARRPTLRSAAWSVLVFLVLCMGGAAIALSPWWWLAVVAAGATGLFHAWAWVGLVHALVCTDGTITRVPVAPIAATGFVAIAVGISALAFDAITGGPSPDGPTESAGEGAPVLVAAGFSSSWDGRQQDLLGPDFHEVQFSYRGLGTDDRPLPYDAVDTHATLPVLVGRMQRQIEALHRRTGEPVSVVAQSEGSLVAAAAALTADREQVERVVLLSPLLHPVGVYYPPEGSGWGIGGRWSLEAVTALVGEISPYAADPGLPFLTSLVAHGPAVRALSGCAIDGSHVVALVPVVHGLASPAGLDHDLPTHAVAAFHAGFLGAGHDDPVIRAALLGRDLPGRGFWQGATVAASAVGAGWQVPQVPVGLPPAWRDQSPVPDCGEVADALAPPAG